MDAERNEETGLREGDLLAYLEGAAGPELARRIAGDPALAAELRGLGAADALLATALGRAACPTTVQLLEYQAGLLEADAAAVVAAHAAGCADCAAELALLADPPELSLAGRLAQMGKGFLRAALQPASARPAVALRGARARTLSYDAGAYQITLAVQPPAATAGLYQIEGQILGADEALAAGAGIATLGGAAPERSAEIDEAGFFAFEDLAPGSYDLALQVGAEVLLLEGVVVMG